MQNGAKVGIGSNFLFGFDPILTPLTMNILLQSQLKLQIKRLFVLLIDLPQLLSAG